jgi:hypothetical protein
VLRRRGRGVRAGGRLSGAPPAHSSTAWAACIARMWMCRQYWWRPTTLRAA